MTCSIEDCQKPAKSRGWCNRHYENWRRYGNPIPKRDRSLEDRIRDIGWSVKPNGCWEWNGPTNENGYGTFTSKKHKMEKVRAHRVVYELFVGKIPDGMHLCHHCDNPPCVNPEHLFPGTRKDNMSDMVSKRRHWAHNRTVCKNGHDLTLPGAIRVLERRGGTENLCVKCARDRANRYQRRVRAKRD